MSNNTKRIGLGLAFPNAILFGLALIFFGCYGLYNTYWTQLYEITPGLILKTVFLFIPILLGLIPFTSTKQIEFDNENIYSFNQLYFFIKIGSTFRINEYNGISIRKGKEIYDIESEQNSTAKPEYSFKFYDIILRDKEGNHTLLIKNIGSQKNAKIAFNEILSRTNYEYLLN
ncbi:MAG: hypothetical protein KAR57_02615 [Bacteroidales bacterium]|nr:hypothetical protein [Bacteroidales bacterium]